MTLVRTQPDPSTSLYRVKTRDPQAHYSTDERRHWQARVLEHLANGRPVASFVRETREAPTTATIAGWAARDHEFGTLYNAALLLMADALVDQIIDIADSRIDPKRAAVMIKARQYVASVLNAARYGAKVDVTSQGRHVGDTIDPDASPLTRIRTIVERAKARKVEDAGSLPILVIDHVPDHANPGERGARWPILE